MKILLAVDGSDYTRKMLAYVCSQSLFDERHDYTIFHAQPPLPGRAAAAAGPGAARDYHQEESQKVLEPALAALRARGFRASTAWKTGPIGETIARFAEEGQFALVIMGTHGYGTFGRLVMGSVTTQVVAHCTVPVLLVQ